MKIDIAIPFRLIWKTRPYIGQPWSSGRIPACQHNGIITQKKCKSTTVRRRVPENMAPGGECRLNSLTILTISTQEVRDRDQPFDVESRDSSFPPSTELARGMRTDGDASRFDDKTDRGSIPRGCNNSVRPSGDFFFFSSRIRARLALT